MLGLLFAMLLGIGCGLMVGAAPAAQLARVDPLAAFRSGARSAGRSRLRNTLMGIQVALALVVLIVAGRGLLQLPGNARHRSRLPP